MSIPSPRIGVTSLLSIVSQTRLGGTLVVLLVVLGVVVVVEVVVVEVVVLIIMALG